MLVFAHRLAKSVPPCFLLLVSRFQGLPHYDLHNNSICLAMAIMVYALYTYHWRASSIRRGGRGPYDDRVGPVSSCVDVVTCAVSNPFPLKQTVLCAALLSELNYSLCFQLLTEYCSSVAVIVNFILRFTQT
jgi:hypothetical protein